MNFEVCKNRSKTRKLAAWGGHRANARTAGRNERGCREGGEGLKTLRVMQKSAENCKELGIRKLLQEFCGMVKAIPHASSWLRPGAADLIEAARGRSTAAPGNFA